MKVKSIESKTIQEPIDVQKSEHLSTTDKMEQISSPNNEQTHSNPTKASNVY